MNMEEEIIQLKTWKEFADRRFEQLFSELHTNTEMTKEIKRGNDEILALLTSGKMGAGLVKWIVSLGAGITVILAFWHSK
jgi:hypothetical protein